MQLVPDKLVFIVQNIQQRALYYVYIFSMSFYVVLYQPVDVIRTMGGA